MGRADHTGAHPGRKGEVDADESGLGEGLDAAVAHDRLQRRVRGVPQQGGQRVRGGAWRAGAAAVGPFAAKLQPAGALARQSAEMARPGGGVRGGGVRTALGAALGVVALRRRRRAAAAAVAAAARLDAAWLAQEGLQLGLLRQGGQRQRGGAPHRVRAHLGPPRPRPRVGVQQALQERPQLGAAHPRRAGRSAAATGGRGRGRPPLDALVHQRPQRPEV
jgi:hypothetical protein